MLTGRVSGPFSFAPLIKPKRRNVSFLGSDRGGHRLRRHIHPTSFLERATMPHDLASLIQHPSRRAFMGTALAATGLALAAQPVTAQTITTGTDGLDAGPVLIPVTDRDLPAYAARPKGDTPVPVILVVQEIFGVHDYIRDICRRLAQSGYLAIAPELYARQGNPADYTDIPTLMRDLVSKVPDAQVLSDLDHVLRWAGQSAGGDVTRAGITGFCWGGRITWLYAAHNPRLKAAVAWYGRLEGDTTPMTPRHPLEIAAGLTVPVLGLYGGADQGIPVASVDRMKTALAGGTSASSIIIYDGAPHAFHADYRASYRETAARDGWSRLTAWFADHGLSPR